MHRITLQRAAAEGILPWNGFISDRFVVASDVLGCGGSNPTPQVQFQVLPTTSSSGKWRQSLSVSKLTYCNLISNGKNKFRNNVHSEIEYEGNRLWKGQVPI